MKFKKLLVVLILVVGLTSVAHADDPTVTALENVSDSKIVLPEIYKHTFKNGMKLYYLQSQNLPIIKMQINLEMGRFSEKPEESPLYDLMTDHIFGGGSQKYTPEQVDELTDIYLSYVNAELGDELTTFSLKCLTQDQNLTFDIFFDHLKHPRFDDERFGILKQNYLNAILKRNETPEKIAHREFSQIFFGEDSYRARTFNEKALQPITTTQLKELHAKSFVAGRMFLVASAPYTPDEFVKLVEPFIADIPPAKDAGARIKPTQPSQKQGFYFIESPSTQSTIRIGHAGGLWNDPNRFAVRIANDILGQSGFASRLMRRLRSELGYVYTIRSSYNFGRDYGTFSVGTNARLEITPQAVNEIKSVIQKFVVDPQITEDAVQESIKRNSTALIFNYDTPFKIVDDAFENEYYGYPSDYPNYLLSKLKEQNVDTVTQAVKNYFHPEKMLVLVVGDPSLKETMMKEFNAKVLPLDQE